MTNQTLPGFKPITEAERLKHKAAAPLAPAADQKPCNLGLFDDGARDQLDLVELAKQKGQKQCTNL